MTTLVWVTGFEHGLATLTVNGGGLCNIIQGTPTVQGTTKRTGGYALQVNPTASTYYVIKNFTANAMMVGRLYIRFASWPAVDIDILLHQVSAGSDLGIELDVANKQLRAIFGATNGNSASPVLSLNTWYRVDYKFDTSTGISKIDLQVDGTAATQSTFSQTLTTMTDIIIGSTTSGSFNMFYDDMVVSNTSGDYPIGAGEVVGLSPNAGGTSSPNPPTNIQDNGSVTVNDSTNPANIELDDVPFGTTTDFIKQVGTQTGYAGVGFADTAQTVIHGVIALEAYHSATTTANSASARMWDGTTVTAIYTGDMSETTLFYKSKILPNPSGGWTMALVNGLQGRVGYATDFSPVPYWDTLMIEVAYATVAGITGTLSVTLDNISLSAAGVVSVVGTLTKTLDAIGLSAIGAVSVIGSLTKTLDDISKTITGAVDVIGSLSKTLDDMTFEASGTVGAAQITGALNVTLDAIALSASGAVAVAGSLDKTLDGIELSAIGAVSITSVLTKTLDGISLSAAGIVSVSGISNITLDGIGINAAGVVSISGGLTKTLDNISLAGAGVVTVTGTLTKTLDGIILSASGTVGGAQITGTLDVALDDLSITATGQIAISGNLNITLDNIILIAMLKRNVVITIQEAILWKKIKNIRNNPSSISCMSSPLDRRGR